MLPGVESIRLECPLGRDFLLSLLGKRTGNPTGTENDSGRAREFGQSDVSFSDRRSVRGTFISPASMAESHLMNSPG